MKDFIDVSRALVELAGQAPALVPLVLSVAVLAAFIVIGLALWRLGNK